MNLTKVIKDSISSNTIASIEKDSAESSGKLVSTTISHIFITDETWANTANVGYTNDSLLTNYIKIAGKNFQPGANVFLTRGADTFFNSTYICNSYYVNYTEMRASFPGINSATPHTIYLQNPDGTTAIVEDEINFIAVPNP